MRCLAHIPRLRGPQVGTVTLQSASDQRQVKRSWAFDHDGITEWIQIGYVLDRSIMTITPPRRALFTAAVACLLLAGGSARPALAETLSRTRSASTAAPSWISSPKLGQAWNCTLTSGSGAYGLAPWPAAVRARIGAEFGVRTIGGYRSSYGRSDHHTGHALDVMVQGSRGDEVARWVQAHASELNVKYVIWQQGYWQPGMSGYRSMADRGSQTANHWDHVHISFHTGWGSCPS